MPTELADNTRVVRPAFVEPVVLSPQAREQLQRRRMQELAQQNQAQLWDADKIKRYENMQNFYNNNF